ncbi:MAG: Two-component system response regulator [Solirubrobacterales bacterium]|nr:Two-component system response regulator [Solirubrobacterales bacterium]
MSAIRPCHVLVVEDNHGDAVLAQEAFREAGVLAALDIVRDGEQAIRYLEGVTPFAGRDRPDLILLDLKLPIMNGHEVLRALKADPRFAAIPVLVLTTSTAESDVSVAYELHANSYLRKPIAFDDFVDLARSIADYWLDMVVLPPA